MQLCLRCLCRSGLHRSSGLQKAQAIKMTNGSVYLSDPVIGAAAAAPCKADRTSGGFSYRELASTHEKSARKTSRRCGVCGVARDVWWPDERDGGEHGASSAPELRMRYRPMPIG
jgi:hypothetical protein